MSYDYLHKVIDELRSLPREELVAEMNKHRDSDTAVGLRQFEDKSPEDPSPAWEIAELKLQVHQLRNRLENATRLNNENDKLLAAQAGHIDAWKASWQNAVGDLNEIAKENANLRARVEELEHELNYQDE